MDIVNELLNLLGLSGGGAGAFALFVLVARAIAKRIPDSATGAVGFARKTLKVLGAYTENKA